MSKPFKMKGFPKHSTSALHQNLSLNYDPIEMPDLENLDSDDLNLQEVQFSEKTKRLTGEVEAADIATDKATKQHKLATGKKGKYGKGLLGGYLRRKGAKKKYKKAGEKEDALRRKLEKSESYDKMTPEQRDAHDKEKQKEMIHALHYLNTGQLPNELRNSNKKNKAVQKATTPKGSVDTKPSFSKEEQKLLDTSEQARQQEWDKKYPMSSPDWKPNGGEVASYTSPTAPGGDYLANVESRRKAQGGDPYAYRKNEAGELEYNLNPESSGDWTTLGSQPLSKGSTLESVQNQIEGYFKTKES